MDEDFFDDINESGGLIDDDPALDYILYEEMKNEEAKQPQNAKGCLGVFVLFLLPVSGLYWALSMTL
jgi:hypothetical protein